MDKYWIKIHRKIQESAIWESDEPFDYRSAWVDLLMEANVSNKEIVYQGRVIKVKRGDVYTSIRKLAKKWNWSRDKVSRYINLLEKLGMIKRNNSVKCATLLTLVNYGKYQDRADTNKTINKDTDKARDKDTDKDTNKALLKNIQNTDIEEKRKDLDSGSKIEEEEETYIPDEEEEETNEWFESLEDESEKWFGKKVE